MIMYGVSGSVVVPSSGEGPSSSPATGACHQASRPSVHGVATAPPARCTTSTRRTDGAAATAASATALSPTQAPRRRKPSAVIRTDASESASRVAIAGAP